MKYISTRGQTEPVSFSSAVLEGLARDGGLFVPEYWPDVKDNLEAWKNLSYQELALEVISLYVGDEIEKDVLKKLVDRSYQSFSKKEITPVIFQDSFTVLELFHGPTLAFKDIALQFLGNLFEELLKKDDRKLNIIGATSGDTGSAAIHGVRGKHKISIFMLHPQGRVSPIQEKQMTTILDENVHNIAIEGTFDDGQNIVKDIFNDLEFKDEFSLGAVNSINWARILAQIVYYFYATFRFEEKYGKDVPLKFSVPSGNFGDIFAGYVAKQMGLPIEKLIIATNENDILARVLQTGEYKIAGVHPTISPSMDIQISSNFERFLFDLFGRDGAVLRSKMDDLKTKGGFTLSPEELKKAQEHFSGVSANTEETLACIKEVAEQGMVLDPHTAVGVVAAKKETTDNVICLATAHPAKFRDAVVEAIGKEPEQPEAIQGILEKESKCLLAPNSSSAIKDLIRKHHS
ncbi:MAG: threonine synthase [bacterium]|jgi:threonine synthase